MKLTNKILSIFVFCVTSLMAKDEIDTKSLYGTDVALVNIFWNEYSKNRDEIFIDDYLFSISEEEKFYIVKCDLNIERLKKQYKKAHPNANMKYLSIKGGCGWGKISKDSLKIIDKLYFK